MEYSMNQSGKRSKNLIRTGNTTPFGKPRCSKRRSLNSCVIPSSTKHQIRTPIDCYSKPDFKRSTSNLTIRKRIKLNFGNLM